MKLRSTIAIVAMSMLAAFAMADDRGPEWRGVDEAIGKGLPRTAVERLVEIEKSAIRAHHDAEAIRAIAHRIVLESQIEGGRAEERVIRMKAETARAPREMRPVMEAILANWFWQYFEENRWRFLGRSTTASSPSDDIATWDLPRIYAEIDTHFVRALADREILQRTPIAEYDALLERTNANDAYRPTLYDFLVHQALDFYASGEQGAAHPEDVFEPSAESPFLGSTEEFLAWRPETTDEASPKLRAIRLFQDLLRFHASDSYRSPFDDAELARLRYAKNAAFGEAKSARYKAALKSLAERNADHELSSRAFLEWARTLHEEGKLSAAWEVAKRGAERFPESEGARACRNLIRSIEEPSLTVSTERVWNAAGPKIAVRYRNLERVHFRLLRVTVDEVLASPGFEHFYVNGPMQLRTFLEKPPQLEWTERLEPTSDFRERVREFTAPQAKKGVYRLIASPDPGFDEKRPIQVATVWVSDLAIVQRSTDRDIAGGLVTNAMTGEPIAGARIRFWLGRNGGGFSPGPDGVSDDQGRFPIPFSSDAVLTVASYRDDRLAAAEALWNYRQQPPTPYERTMFFTDRAIYRPGQVVLYKGIVIGVDSERDRYETIRGLRIVAVFADGNGKEIERREHVTNDYGSFSGSFTTPADRLLGRMSIRVEGGPDGQVDFRVEEYKRPKFQVTIDTSREARLGASVTMSGTATAYTGAAIDGAEVRWRVVRQVRYAPWRRALWWGWEPPSGQQEIAHGRTRTGADGAFEVRFVARPDPAIDETDEPAFDFQVRADVTDLAGETRSAERTIPVGFTAMAASLTAPEWLVDGRPVEVEVSTATLDGAPNAGEGTLTVRRLEAPDEIERAPLGGRDEARFRSDFGRMTREERRGTGPATWKDGVRVLERAVATDTSGHAKLSLRLGTGLYRARFRARDAFGKFVVAEHVLQVIDPAASRPDLPVPDFLVAPKWTLEPGEDFVAVWGSGYERARALVEIEKRGKILASYWTEPGRTQHVIRWPITEPMRGGFTLRVTMVRENRAYRHSEKVEVPRHDRELKVRWEHLVSKLEPGQRETWTAVITGADATRAVAEMVATLYDASLDQYTRYVWPNGFGVFPEEPVASGYRFENRAASLQPIAGGWPRMFEPEGVEYRRFPGEIAAVVYSRGYVLSNSPAATSGGLEEIEVRSSQTRHILSAGVSAGAALQSRGGRSDETIFALDGKEVDQSADGSGSVKGPGQVSPRRNLQETAFFFPHLISNRNGEVRLEFTMPEALTEWRFLGFAHDRDLRTGLLEGRAVTSKDLMVQPNPPRFLREDDVLEFTVKVTNRSDAPQSGRVRLTLADGRSGASIEEAFGIHDEEQRFEVPARESRTYAWRLKVPDGAGYLVYRATASAARVSDGEEGWLPVLSRRVLVTESLPLPMRGRGTRTFDFARLAHSGESSSLRHQSLTVQMVSNPSWYAVMALPYLIEYPYECSEQTFNRLYANALAHHIATSDPKIERVFDRWRGTKALDSPLEKNQELKSVLLEETPWLRQAKGESQARRDVGVLFDRARLANETARLEAKLRDLQLGDGAWPWFPGGRPNDYITLYITAGLARLKHLGVPVAEEPAQRALLRIDRWAEEWYREIQRQGHPDDDHLSSTAALYLYTRSFSAGAKNGPPPNREVLDYWLGQARRYWVPLASRQSQAHLALAFHRFGDRETARAIVRSLAERSVEDPEMGRYWRDSELSWWWYRAPIETQAMMIEAFDEVTNDAAAVEACKVWLLKQKQTRDWKTTKATADAVYALLLRGTGPLASSDLVEVALGGRAIVPETVEAGTGFYEQRFGAAEIRPEMGRVTVTKQDAGVAWGSVQWQYLEDMSRVAAYEGTPLKLVKAIYRKQASKRGPLVEKVAGPVAVGDELIVRIELRADRDMEYVHLKDLRGSGLEPVNVLSGYRYQDGLAYYEQTRDTATHFFIDYLPKGTYVFEYPLRVQHVGRYQSGVAQIQCLYAPEFGSHSESVALEVR
jgi:hypothetical protein